MICRGAIVVLNLGHGKKGMGEKEIPISVCEPFNYRPSYGSVQCLKHQWIPRTYGVPFLKMLRIQVHFCSLHE